MKQHQCKGYIQKAVWFVAAAMLLIILPACGEKSGQSATADSTQTSTDSIAGKSDAAVNSNPDKAALSFYEWYIRKVNTTGEPGPKLLPGEKGFCSLELTGYFNELKALGTISQKFIDKETQRFKECGTFLAGIKYTEVEKAQPYAYAQSCPYFYYYFWLNSQEPVDGIEIEKKELKETAAVYSLIPVMGNKKTGTPPTFRAEVSLEKEAGSWMITQIVVKAAQQ